MIIGSSGIWFEPAGRVAATGPSHLRFCDSSIPAMAPRFAMLLKKWQK